MRAKKVLENVNFTRTEDPKSSLDIGKYRGMRDLPLEMKETILLLKDTGYWRDEYNQGMHLRTEDEGPGAHQFFWDYSKQEKQYHYQGAKLLWSSLIWISWRAPEEFEDEHPDIVNLMYEAGGFPSFEGSVQIQKIDPNSDTVKHYGGPIKAEVSVRTDDDSIEFPDSYTAWFDRPEDVAPFIAKKLKSGETYIKKALEKKYKHLTENLDFERGRDPKTSMGIGKAALNPFMNGTFYSMPFHEFIANRGNNKDIRWKFLKGAAELLGVKGHKILVALDYKRRPIDGIDLEMRNLDNWSNSGKEIELDEEWFLTLDTNGVVHVTQMEEGDKYILGVKY